MKYEFKPYREEDKQKNPFYRTDFDWGLIWVAILFAWMIIGLTCTIISNPRGCFNSNINKEKIQHQEKIR